MNKRQKTVVVVTVVVDRSGVVHVWVPYYWTGDRGPTGFTWEGRSILGLQKATRRTYAGLRTFRLGLVASGGAVAYWLAGKTKDDKGEG